MKIESVTQRADKVKSFPNGQLLQDGDALLALPSAANKEWDIFLSHNDADKAWVKDLAAQLEAEPLENKPDSRRIRVFLDEWDIQVGENIVLKLNEGMSKSRFIALIMTPEFFRANWTALEWTNCVAEDPRNTRGRMIPILYRDVSLDGKEAISLPAPFRAIKSLDFRTPKSRKDFYVELLNLIRCLPQPRGESRRPTPGTFPTPGPRSIGRRERWKPDDVSELLISNLLPVSSLPAKIWSAATTLRKTREVYEQVNSGDGVIINGDRLYTFAQLSDELCPLRSVVDVSTISDKDRRDDWLANKGKGHLYTWLLNSYLRKFLEEVGLNQDEKERFFFPPGSPSSWTLSITDFADLPSLSNKLRQPNDPVSEFLSGTLTDATKQLLATYHGRGSDAQPLAAGLATDLNSVLAGAAVYDAQRFAKVHLRSETSELLTRENIGSVELVKLNRLLLEDTFPREIWDARRVVFEGRELTGRRPSPQPDTDFWVHTAAEIRFQRVWDRYFLKIVPCFFFTHDGRTPLDGKQMGRMCIRWGGRQRNPNILRDLILWISLLKRNSLQIRISSGTENLEVCPLPATSRSNRGIRNDHIRFGKLMRFAPDVLAAAVSDLELTPHDDDENTTPQE